MNLVLCHVLRFSSGPPHPATHPRATATTHLRNGTQHAGSPQRAYRTTLPTDQFATKRNGYAHRYTPSAPAGVVCLFPFVGGWFQCGTPPPTHALPRPHHTHTFALHHTCHLMQLLVTATHTHYTHTPARLPLPTHIWALHLATHCGPLHYLPALPPTHTTFFWDTHLYTTHHTPLPPVAFFFAIVHSSICYISALLDR